MLYCKNVFMCIEQLFAGNNTVMQYFLVRTTSFSVSSTFKCDPLESSLFCHAFKVIRKND